MRRVRHRRSDPPAAGVGGPSRSTSTVATACLAAVLLTLAGFVVVGSVRTARAADEAARAMELAAAHQEVRHGILSQELHAREYQLRPTAIVEQRYRAAGQQVDAGLGTIRSFGGTAAAGSGLMAVQQQRYRATGAELFTAVAARQEALAHDLRATELDPIAFTLQAQAESAAATQERQARDGIAALRATQQEVLVVTVGVLAVAVVLLSVIWRVLLGYQRDLLAQAQLNAHQARHDALTGLPNRALFEDRLEAALATGARTAVLVLDLDRFKEVNDTMGHHIGDQLLVLVGRRVRDALRDGDTVARMGGDEFAALLPDVVDVDEAVAVAGRITAALQQPLVLESVRLDVGISIGVAVAPAHADTSDHLLRCADSAMYRAKSEAGGWSVHDPARGLAGGRLELVPSDTTAVGCDPVRGTG